MNETNERSVAAAGSQPEVWAVCWEGDEKIDRSKVYGSKDAARLASDECPSLRGEVVPLYRSPTLTDAEREAIERGIDSLLGVEDMSAGAGTADDAAACLLRSLLERLK